MKKKTYRILTSIPLVGIVVKIKTSPGRSWPVRTTCCSPAMEAQGKDPRGFLVAHNEAIEQALAPAKAYIKEHPDQQLTAQLVNRLSREQLYHGGKTE